MSYNEQMFNTQIPENKPDLVVSIDETDSSNKFSSEAFLDEELTDDDWEEIFRGLHDSTDGDDLDESETLFNEAKRSYNKVDDKLLDFIGNFVVNQNNAAVQKKKLKNIFFGFTMACFALIVLTPIVCLIVLMHSNVDNYYIIFGSIVAAFLEVLTTVIVLPKIVAEYLFNKEEENANIKIVELMQKYSETMHGYDDKN